MLLYYIYIISYYIHCGIFLIQSIYQIIIYVLHPNVFAFLDCYHGEQFDPDVSNRRSAL